jgi:hypothetical protein
MAKSTDLNFPKAIGKGFATFLPADTTTAKDILSAGADDSKVTVLNATSDSASATVLRIFIHDGTTAFQIGAASVPANAGTNGTVAAVDLIGASIIPALPVDVWGKRYIPLPAGCKIQVAALAAVDAGKVVTVTALSEDY